MTLEDFVRVVESATGRSAHRCGKGWMATCPAHDDRTPSLSLREGEDGRLLVHDFGQCSTASVLTAVGLRSTDLFPHAMGSARVPRARLPRSSRPQRLPHPDEVIRLLQATVPVVEDEEVAGFLASRGLRPETIRDRFTLARALPLGTRCPAWARFGGRPWSETPYRLLVPLFTPGQWRPAAVRARSIQVGAEPKALAATGASVAGLVMADQLGRHIVAEGSLPDDWPPDFVPRIAVAEGETDFWSLATFWPDAHPSPAVLGIVSGSWTQQLAERIPTGVTVEVRTDCDASGDRMAEAVADTLADRCLVMRACPRDCRS